MNLRLTSTLLYLSLFNITQEQLFILILPEKHITCQQIHSATNRFCCRSLMEIAPFVKVWAVFWSTQGRKATVRRIDGKIQIGARAVQPTTRGSEPEKL